MDIRRLCAASLAVAAAVATSACCGGEQHAVTVSAPDLFTVNVGSTTLETYSNRQLTSPPIESSKLEFIFNTLEGAADGDGVIISFSGNDASSSGAILLSVALPVGLHDGDVYTVGRTFTNDPNAADEGAAYGPYDLAQPNQAEVAFSASTYTFPPPHFDVNYRATNTTGTIRVSHRLPGQLELTLDLSFTDADGNPAMLTGRALAVNDRFNGSCS